MNTEVFQLIPLEKITVKGQVRTEFKNIDELANSLKAQGQQVPITVYADPEKEGAFILYHGERRWRAAKIAGLTDMKAVIVPAPESESDRISSQLTENMLREDMAPMEIAAALSLLSQGGMRITNIADKTGLDRTLISRYLALGELPPELAAFVNDRTLEDVIAIDLIKRAFKVSKRRTLAAIEDLKNEAIEQAQRDGTPNTKPEPFRLSRRMAKKIATDVSVCQTVTKSVDQDAPSAPDTSMHLAPRGGGSGGSSGGSSKSSSSTGKKSGKAPKKSGKEQIEDANPFMAPPKPFETEPDENGAVAVGNSSWKKPEAKPEDDTDEPPFDEADEVLQEEESPEEAQKHIKENELPEGCHLTKGTRAARIRVNVWTTSEINGDMMQQEGWLETNIVCDDPAFCCVKLDSGMYIDFAVECISIASVAE